MTFRVGQRANRQLAEINKFIGTDNEDAASEMLRKMTATFEQLTQFPKLGHIGRREGTREFVQVPFVIVYRIQRSEIVIVGVFHGKQKYI